MELSEKQQRIVGFAVDPSVKSMHTVGAVRSGKTWAVGLSNALHLLNYPYPANHFLIARSLEVAYRNVAKDLVEHHIPSLGGKARITRTWGTHIVVTGGKAEQIVWLLGANDSSAYTRIRGATAAGMLVDEVTVIPKDLFITAWQRLSAPGAKCWTTCNPDAPAHWYKREVVDELESFQGELIECLMEDNPSLSDEYKKLMEDTHHGFMRDRYILGLWAAASGLIFPSYEVTDVDPNLAGMTLALDWAVSGTLAAIAFFHDRSYEQAVATHELYVDGSKETITPASAAERIYTLAAGILGRSPAGTHVIHDPSMSDEVERQLQRMGLVPVAGENDVLPGIGATQQRLSEGTVKIHRRCTNLLQEIAGYVWDETWAKAGLDKPLKQKDHGPDALRYFVFSRMSRVASIPAKITQTRTPIRVPSRPLRFKPLTSGRARGMMR